MSNHLQYKEYIGTVEYSDEDEVFFGKVFGTNDLITFEGTSVHKLKSAFKSAVEDYLETCKKINKHPDRSFKGSFNIRIDPSLHKRAAEQAVRKKMTLNDFVKSAIATAVEKD